MACTPLQILNRSALRLPGMQRFLREFLHHAAQGRIPTIRMEFSNIDPESSSWDGRRAMACDDDPEKEEESDSWLANDPSLRQRTLRLSKGGRQLRDYRNFAKFFKVTRKLGGNRSQGCVRAASVRARDCARLIPPRLAGLPNSFSVAHVQQDLDQTRRVLPRWTAISKTKPKVSISLFGCEDVKICFCPHRVALPARPHAHTSFQCALTRAPSMRLAC